MPTKPTIISAMVKPYTDYLDKELTIVGVLGAFCVAGVGLFAEKSSSGLTQPSLRVNSNGALVVGCRVTSQSTG